MRDSRKAADAAKTLVKAVDGMMVSWRALHPQVRWAIDDMLVECYGVPAERLAAVKLMMQDGSATYWQRFWQATDAERRALVRKVLKGGGQ